jgi:glycosyltransferase involved in cell wall biosynthesis
MTSITVAIWMVTYNHEAYIEQAIRSVMQQQTSFTYKLLIGEDCSIDTTRAICKKLQNEFPEHIELILNETNLGSTKNAINTYTQCFESKPTYIALLEGDDYWTDPLKLQKQVDFLEAHKNYTFSMTRFLALRPEFEFKDENKRFFEDDTHLVYDFDMFTKGWYGGTLTVLFRASVIDVKIFRAYHYFRDIHLYTELLKKGNGVCQNFVSAVYRIHDSGQHNSLSNLERTKVAVSCYQELLKSNRSIPQIQQKYRYFQHSYIKELVGQKHYLAAFKQAFLFGFYMNDLNFVISNFKRITKNMFKGRRIWMFKIIKNKLLAKPEKKKFLGSQHYWEQRYKANKNSGVGSYGRLAEFKATILNTFVKDHAIQTVIEYGCGDGHQLSLANYPNYIGFDVSQKALELCKERFKNDPSKVFYPMDDLKAKDSKAELVLSLDVLYHLIEDAIFETYMNQLFKSSSTYVIIYSSNYDEHKVAHVKDRTFTNWIAANISNEWQLLDHIRNKYPFDSNNPEHTSMADFYIYKKVLDDPSSKSKDSR